MTHSTYHSTRNISSLWGTGCWVFTPILIRWRTNTKACLSTFHPSHVSNRKCLIIFVTGQAMWDAGALPSRGDGMKGRKKSTRHLMVTKFSKKSETCGLPSPVTYRYEQKCSFTNKRRKEKSGRRKAPSCTFFTLKRATANSIFLKSFTCSQYTRWHKSGSSVKVFAS